MSTTSHRIYLNSASGISNGGSEYDLYFPNIRVPTISQEDMIDDGWCIAVESFQLIRYGPDLTRLVPPVLLFTDLPNLDGHSTLNHNIPLLCTYGSHHVPVTRDTVGHRLSSSPAKLFQSGGLRIRLTNINGDLLVRAEDQEDPDTWAITLALYRRS